MIGSIIAWHLNTILNEDKFVIVSHGVGKYGRCLGEIYVEETGHNDHQPEISVNRMLINEGHAKEYYGGKRWKN